MISPAFFNSFKFLFNLIKWPATSHGRHWVACRIHTHAQKKLLEASPLTPHPLASTTLVPVLRTPSGAQRISLHRAQIFAPGYKQFWGGGAPPPCHLLTVFSPASGTRPLPLRRAWRRTTRTRTRWSGPSVSASPRRAVSTTSPGTCCASSPMQPFSQAENGGANSDAFCCRASPRFFL